MIAGFGNPRRTAIPSPASGTDSWRDKAGFAIMLLMAALSVGTFVGYRSLLQQNSVTTDIVSFNEQRFQSLRAVLPKNDVVGYLSDAHGHAESTRSYYLAQYALAPVVVAPDSNHELVVGNCASASALARIAAASGLAVVRDFNNGVALLRRERR